MIRAGVLQRHDRMKPIFHNFLCSKFGFKRQPKFGLTSIYVSAGLFRVNEVSMEHGHILTSITGAPFALNSQYHGKRQKRTVSLDCSLRHLQMGNFHDKYVYEFLRYAFEFETPKQFRPKKVHAKTFTGRVREKFRMNPEYEMLFEEFMGDTHRGKFLPLTVNYNIKNPLSNIIAENYIHMLRLPFIWFKRRDRLAFDDRPSDRWRGMRGWYYVIKELIEEKIIAHDRYTEKVLAEYTEKFENIENQEAITDDKRLEIRVLMQKFRQEQLKQEKGTNTYSPYIYATK